MFGPSLRAMATKKQPAAEKGAEADVQPFVILPPSDDGSPSWTVILADSHSPAEIFEELGHTGSGYSWDSVARIAMRGLAPEQAASFEFDSEAGTFVAMSEDGEAVHALASALAALIRDEDALREAIEAVPDDDWDD